MMTKQERPRSPERIRAIVYMRDVRRMRYVDIAAEIGMSGPGVYKQYTRWRNWAVAQGSE
jgi:hypothetical protein